MFNEFKDDALTLDWDKPSSQPKLFFKNKMLGMKLNLNLGLILCKA